MEASSNLVYYSFRTPLSTQIELTSTCTYRCVHCYNYWNYSEKQDTRVLNNEDFVKIIDILGKSKVFELVFTGGEPLLRRDILFNLAGRAKNHNIETRLNSNLVLLNDSDIKDIKSTSIKGVLTSLLSSKEDTHNALTQSRSFNKILGSISRLKNEGIDVAVNMVVMQQNKSDVYDTCRFLYENYKINAFCATPIGHASVKHREMELKKEDVVNLLDTLLKVQNEFGIKVDTVEPIPVCLIDDINKYKAFLRRDCSAGKTTITIGENGEVRPCTHVSKSYGNLLEESLEEIWSKMHKWRDGSYTPNKCRACSALELCSAGCRESAKVINGSYSAEDPYTEGIKPLEHKLAFNSQEFEIPDEKLFCVSPDLRYREENGNYILFSPKRHMALLVTKESFVLVQKLYKGHFSLKTLGGSCATKSILGHLEQRGIIEPI